MADTYGLSYRWTKRVKFSVWCMSWVSFLCSCHCFHVSYGIGLQLQLWKSYSSFKIQLESHHLLEHPPSHMQKGSLVPWSYVTLRELFKHLSRPAFHQTAISTSASNPILCSFELLKNPGGSGRNGDFSSPDCALPPTSSSGLLVLHWLLIVTLLYWDIFRIRSLAFKAMCLKH